MPKRLITFIAVGTFCAVLDIGIMKGALLAGLQAWLAASLGFGISLIANYFLHSKVTFEKKSSWQNLGKYVVIVMLNYSITLACVHLGETLLDSPMTGKLLSLPFVVVVGFLLSKFWAFK